MSNKIVLGWVVAGLSFQPIALVAAPLTCEQLVITCNAGIGSTCMHPIAGVLETEVAHHRVCTASYT
jgi:hypothetical protein